MQKLDIYLYIVLLTCQYCLIVHLKDSMDQLAKQGSFLIKFWTMIR